MPRQSKYAPEYDDYLIAWMAAGKSFSSFGAFIYEHSYREIKVTAQTLFNWLKDYPSFAEAKAVGEGLCQAFWEQIGLDACLGKFQNHSTGTWVFNMKNRFKWTDKVEQTLIGDSSRPVGITTIVFEGVPSSEPS